MHIDAGHLRRAGLLAAQSMASQLAREYQRIKRPLLASLSANDTYGPAASVNRVMVASASQGEGKTFTAFNLAVSLARERDYTVLLVDGDVLKPGISRALGLEDAPGLMDALRDDQAVVNALIRETDVPGLSVLPAGRRCEEMAELLSSRRMYDVAEELSAEPARIVVFDSSPLLATPESQALALMMNQVLVVVKAGATERRALEAALSLIDHPSRPISLVLNQSRKGHGDLYAGYYGVYAGGNSGVETQT